MVRTSGRMVLILRLSYFKYVKIEPSIWPLNVMLQNRPYYAFCNSSTLGGIMLLDCLNLPKMLGINYKVGTL